MCLQRAPFPDSKKIKKKEKAKKVIHRFFASYVPLLLSLKLQEQTRDQLLDVERHVREWYKDWLRSSHHSLEPQTD